MEGAGQTAGRGPGPRRGGGLPVLRGLTTFAGATILLTLVGLNRFGFPDRFTERIARELSRGEHTVELANLRLDFPGGFVAQSVNVYRKGVVAPPVFEAASVRLGVEPRFWRWGGQAWFREIELADGVVRAPLVSWGGVAAGSTAAALPAALRVPRTIGCRLRRMDVFGVWVEQGRGDVHMDADAVRVTDLDAVVGKDLQRGTVAGGLTVTTDSLRARLTAVVDPHVIVPGLRSFGVDQTRVFEWFSFPISPPTCELTVEHLRGDVPRTSIRGRIQATQFAYRGTAIGFGNVSGVYSRSSEGHSLKLESLVLAVGGRTASGTLKLDLDGETVRFEAVSSMEVASLARITGFREGSFLDLFRFGPSRVYMRGVIDYGGWERNEAEIAVESETLAYGPFKADDCAFKVQMSGATNRLVEARGRLAGGSFTGSGQFFPEAPASTNTGYRVKAEVLHADVRALLEGLDRDAAQRIDGRLYGNVELSGCLGAGQGRSATGQGYLNIKRGTMFRVPLFGGLTESLARRVPGMDYITRQSDVRAPFEIRDGRVISRDIQIEGDVLSLTARGSVTFAGALDFDVQVRPMKDKTVVGTAMRAVTYPLSRLLEFRAQGTPGAVRWTSTTFSLGKGERRAGEEESP